MRITHLSMAFCSLGGRCPLLGRSILWCFPAFSCGGKAFRYERYANLTPPKRKGMEIISYKQHILTAYIVYRPIGIRISENRSAIHAAFASKKMVFSCPPRQIPYCMARYVLLDGFMLLTRARSVIFLADLCSVVSAFSCQRSYFSQNSPRIMGETSEFLPKFQDATGRTRPYILPELDTGFGVCLQSYKRLPCTRSTRK